MWPAMAEVLSDRPCSAAAVLALHADIEGLWPTLAFALLHSIAF